jgi:hypothetical protein
MYFSVKCLISDELLDIGWHDIKHRQTESDIQSDQIQNICNEFLNSQPGNYIYLSNNLTQDIGSPFHLFYNFMEENYTQKTYTIDSIKEVQVAVLVATLKHTNLLQEVNKHIQSIKDAQVKI